MPTGTAVALTSGGSSTSPPELVVLQVDPVAEFTADPAVDVVFRATRPNAVFEATLNGMAEGRVTSPYTATSQLGKNALELVARADGNEARGTLTWTYDPDPPTVPVPDLMPESTSSLRLSWTQSLDGSNGSGVARYLVHYDTVSRPSGQPYRGLGANAGPSPIQVPDPTVSTFLDGLDAATTYYVRVEAVDAAGNHSVMSPEVEAGTHSGATGNLTGIGELEIGEESVAMLAADFNADGLLDLAVAARRASTWALVVRLASGSDPGQFPNEVVTPVKGQLVAFASDYLDDDVYPDIAFVTREPAGGSTQDCLYLAFGDGGGGFDGGTPGMPPRQQSCFGFEVEAIDTGMVNDDTVADIGVAGGGQISVLYAVAPQGHPSSLFSIPQVLGSQPPVSHLRIGDVDGDGISDLAIAAADGATQLLFGALTPDGAMLETSALVRVPVATGEPNPALVTTDLNGDGVCDVATVTDQRVDVFLADASVPRRFMNAESYSVGTDLRDLVEGDWDGDGTTDLAVLARGGRELVLLRGQTGSLLRSAGGTLEVATRIALADPDPIAMLRMDVDGDGIPDLATLDGTGGRVWPLASTGNRIRGDGGFGTPRTAVAEPDAVAVRAGDFDGDGILDLVSLSSTTGGKQVLSLRPGLGTWRHGNGAFGAVQQHTSPCPNGCVAALATGDVNGDGLPDVAALLGDVEVGQQALVLYLGAGAPDPLRQVASFSFKTDVSSVAAGDFDGDGRDDLAVTAYGSGADLQLFHWDGARLQNYAAVPLASTIRSRGLVAADVDHDGICDLALATPAGFELYLGTSDPGASVHRPSGTFGSPLRIAVAGKGVVSPDSLQVADVDRDGAGDLLALVDEGSPEQSYLVVAPLRTVGGVPALPELRSIPVAATPAGGLAVLDLDGDHRLDYAITLNRRAEVYVMLGDGYGGVLSRAVFTGLSVNSADPFAQPVPLTAADFDSDGAHDVVLMSPGPEALLGVMLGTGNPTQGGR